MPAQTLFPFVKFQAEADIIGRILAGYTNLEIGLLHCVQMGSGDFDTTLKRMFSIRGETRRILEGELLGEPHYKLLKLDSVFRSAIGSMRHCLKIRNQYSHCAWWDDWSGQLAFANIEEIAILKIKLTDLQHLPVSHVNEALLSEQEGYFAYVDQLLVWINYEGRFKAGKLSSRIVARPLRRKQPPLRLP
jgi:hypothetical protein